MKNFLTWVGISAGMFLLMSMVWFEVSFDTLFN